MESYYKSQHLADFPKIAESSPKLGRSHRRLTPVSNPAGAFLGASQATLEREWKQGLKRDCGVTFDRLFVLNNMLISRFLDWLESTGNLEDYMTRLVNAFNPGAGAGSSCGGQTA